MDTDKTTQATAVEVLPASQQVTIQGINRPKPKVITIAQIKQAKELKGQSGLAKHVPVTLSVDGDGNYQLTFPAVWEDGTVKMGSSGKSVSAYATTGALAEEDWGNITLLDANGEPGMSLPFKSIGFNIILPI
jgi:hypothetical protein